MAKPAAAKTARPKTTREASKGEKTTRKADGKKADGKKGGKKSKAEKEEKAGAAESAAADSSAEAAEEDGRRRPKPETLKSITTGATAAVDFVEDDPPPEVPPVAKPSPPKASPPPAGEASSAASGEGGGGGEVKMTWVCSKWLAEVEGVLNCLAHAMCLESSENVVLEDDAALTHVRALDTRDDLLERLRSGGAMERLADAIWPKVEILKAGPATAAELANQWATEGAGDLLYGDLPDFFSGLEMRIGSPDPKVLKDMMADHCSRPDAQVEFTTGNYSVVTTSEVEWKFVTEPETPLKWPIEVSSAANVGHHSTATAAAAPPPLRCVTVSSRVSTLVPRSGAADER